MTSSRTAVSSPSAEGATPLGSRLALVCHAIRVAAVVWAAWAFYAITSLWGDPARVEKIYSRAVGADNSGATTTQHLGAFAILLIDWAFAAVLAVIVWRLFGHFLAGRIIDIQAVDEMRCLGLAGVAAMVVDILARPLVAAVMSSHVAVVPHRFAVWVQPHDLLHIMMALFVLVLAGVLRRGVVIAEEHRQIV